MLFNIVVVTAAQTCLKYGMSTANTNEAGGLVARLLSLVTVIFTRPYVFTGFVLFAFSSLMWLHILKTTQLSLAYPTVALSYVFTTFLAWRLFGERVNIVSIGGLFLICCGVVLVGVGFSSASSR
jgi:drug/metabolite transporter (DMT)-like permease